MTVSQSSPSAADAENRRRILSGYLLLVLAVLVWAGNSIVGRSAGDAAIPPLGFNFWRWATAFLIFAVFFGVKTWRQRREILAHWKFVTGFAVVSIAGFNSVFYIALQKSTALQVALIQSILPVLVLLLGLVILRQRISPRQWWGIVFSISGAVLIVVRGDIGVLQTLALGEGDIWALGAVFIWAWQAFLMRWKPPTIDIMPFMTTISLIGVITMTPFYIWETANVAPMPVTQTSILFVLYVAVMASFIGTTCWNEGTYRAGGAQAGYFGNLFPIFAGGLAILILGEQPHWYHGVGALCVIIGIWLATAQHSRHAASR
ncbi:MAG: DMT family transporter [Alphaproteobacteria bacterium]|nr:DMT family transporter [Alphaproteobacteria bacterium]